MRRCPMLGALLTTLAAAQLRSRQAVRIIVHRLRAAHPHHRRIVAPKLSERLGQQVVSTTSPFREPFSGTELAARAPGMAIRY